MAGRLAACWLALRLLVPVCVVALAQSDQTTPQDQAKAAFLASFSKYVTWPDGFVPVSDLIIGVVGPSSIAAPLEQQAEQHKTSKQRIEVRRFASIADYRPCHIVFLPAQLSGVQRRRCLKVLRGKPVLLVGESPGFAASGGMINFVAAEQAVHFEINNETCHQAGLKLNAKLLSLGKRVHSP